jgi:hypothetical protein
LGRSVDIIRVVQVEHVYQKHQDHGLIFLDDSRRDRCGALPVLYLLLLGVGSADMNLGLTVPEWIAVLVQQDRQFPMECRPAEPVLGREGGLGIHRGRGAPANLGDIDRHASYSARRRHRRAAEDVIGWCDLFVAGSLKLDARNTVT